MTRNSIAKIFAAIGALGVMLGAFGAHALKERVSLQDQETWRTATLYLFVHTLAGMYSSRYNVKLRGAFFFLAGILLFSGSLYTLVGLQVRALGAVAPLGGLSFIIGWILTVIDTKLEPQ